jgi:putative ABC transport system permease protein
MMLVALRMLFGDRAKYFGIVMGVTLASMVITQQGSIFVGIMSRTCALITDMPQARIWVMDPKVQYIDDVKPLQDTELQRVRSVEGVAWAVPFYKGMVRVRMEDGTFQNCNLLGIDDATLIGGPQRLTSGALTDLRRSDSVLLDRIGAATKLAKPVPGGGPKIPASIASTLEINDRRGVVVGVADAARTFQSQPIIWTTYTRAMQFAPKERRMLSFVLASAAPGEDEAEVCRRITERSGLAAYTSKQFAWLTVLYFITNTGIPINFGIAVVLGLVVGATITGFMFYSFTLDNLRYFGTLKAMGATDSRLLGMIVVQALIVGILGWGLGVGIAAFFGSSAKNTPLAFRMIWQLLFVSGAATTIICVLAAMISIRRVVALEPAVVFKG